MEKPHWELDTILLGTYWVGYNPRYKYFKVKGYTKSGAPRVVELKKEILSQNSSPVDSETVHKISEPLEEIGPIYTSRWATKKNNWGITLDQGYCKDRCSLDLYVPGTTFSEMSYY